MEPFEGLKVSDILAQPSKQEIKQRNKQKVSKKIKDADLLTGKISPMGQADPSLISIHA